MQNGKKLLIIGAGGHGKVIADIAKSLGRYAEIAFLDDDKEVSSVLGYPCIGSIEHLQTVTSNETEVFIAIGNASIREKMTVFVRKQGFGIATLIHPNAVIGSEVHIGSGTAVMAGAVVNAGAKIGESVIINTTSSVDHDCVVGDYTHIAVGAHVAGTVTIGEKCWIGAGAVISNNINLVANVTIGAGGVVIRDIEENGTYVGVPVRKL